VGRTISRGAAAFCFFKMPHGMICDAKSIF
jgi:hypothetical protein